MEGILRWMKRYAAKHEKQILEAIPESHRKHATRLSPAMRQRVAMWSIIGQWGQTPRSGEDLPRTDEDLADLRSQLSIATQKTLQQKPSAEQWQIVASWARQAGRHYSGSRRFGGGPRPADFEKELDDFFEKELNDSQREHLLGLSSDEMQRELWQMYVMKFRPPGPPRGPRRPGDRPGMRGPERGLPGQSRPGRRPEFSPGRGEGRPRPEMRPGGEPHRNH